MGQRAASKLWVHYPCTSPACIPYSSAYKPVPARAYTRLQEAFSRETSEDVRLGALECMTSLYYSQGRYLSIGVNETAALATKYCLK